MLLHVQVQGEYVIESQTDSLFLLADYKPNLGCSVPSSLLTTYGLWLFSAPSLRKGSSISQI